MDERAQVAGLHRRFGFGLVGGTLDVAVGRGLVAEVDRLLSPEKHSLEAPADPFTGLNLGFQVGGNRQAGVDAADAWLERMVRGAGPLEDRMAWFWHGLLVSNLAKVKAADAMANQIRLFWTHGTGRLPALLSAITVDPAMLAYLDGKDSTGTTPNENYSRELLELFALGVGNYAEADVQAGAVALSGWTVRVRQGGAPNFAPRLHNDGPQHYLGVSGVHDVASVVAAVTGHPACARHLAERFARATLGGALDDSEIDALAAGFATSGLDISALVRATVERHVAGVKGIPIVLGPVPWLVMAQRATGAHLRPGVRISGLRAAGQVPFLAPSVAGWPGGDAWYVSATMVGRLNLALRVAAATPPDSLALSAARSGNWDALSRALGLPVDFAPSTVAGLSWPSDAFQRLALALVSPEFVEV